MSAFDDTDWSRWLLGACTSGSALRSAVVRNASQVTVLRDRVAELEAELHARNVEAKGATIQAVGLRKQMADAIDVLSAS